MINSQTLSRTRQCYNARVHIFVAAEMLDVMEMHGWQYEDRDRRRKVPWIPGGKKLRTFSRSSPEAPRAR